MPLSLELAAIADAFRLPFRLQMRPISLSLWHLHKWLKPRFERAQELERAHRDFPFVLFYNDAVQAWLDSSQRGRMASTGPPHSIWDSFAVGGRKFVQGIGRTKRAYDEEMVLPNFVQTIEAAVAAIVASVDRFRTPTASMFDPRLRTASDLFGEAALGFRAFITSLKQIQGVAAGGQELKKALGLDKPAAGGAGKNDDIVATLDALAASFGDITRYLVAGLLLVPVFGRWLEVVLHAADLNAKLVLLDQFEKMERKVYAWRVTILEFFYVGLFRHLRKAVALVAAVETILLRNMQYYIRYGILYAVDLLTNLTTFATKLHDYLKSYTDLIESIRAALEAIMNIDLTPIILAALAPLAPIISTVGRPPAFTVGDLFDTTVGMGTAAARATFDEWLKAIEKGLFAADQTVVLVQVQVSPGTPPVVDFDNMRARIRALREALHLALTPTTPLPPEAAEPSLAGVSFPNVYRTIFGAGGAAYIGGLLKGVRDEARVDILDIIGTARDFLEQAGDRFGDAATRAARLGSLDQYRQVAERADRLSNAALGDQADELRKRVAATAPDALEVWLRGRGFFAIGDAIPLYVQAMRRYWREQAERLPTSPHLLDRREQLGRVQIKQVVIKAPARPLNDALADEVAARFRGAVQEAYGRGMARLRNAPAG